MILRRLTLTLFLTLSVSVAAIAQTNQAHGTQLYGIFGIGERVPLNLAIAEIGFGGEHIFRGGIGAGAEIAYVSALRDLTGSGVGPISFDASYHFATRGSRDRFDAFIRGGYTGFVAFGAANGMNLGGGLNYWLNNRIALRLEFVDQIVLQSRTRNFLLARIGFTFGHR